MAFDTSRYTKNPFLKGEDLEEGERVVVTIKSAEEVTFPSGDTVPVLEFLELEQKLTLNKTRIKRLVELLGEDTDEWISQRISLYQVPVQYQGKTMPGVAVGKAPPKVKKQQTVEADVEFAKPAKKTAAAQPAVEFERAAKQAVAAEDDDIPF